MERSVLEQAMRALQASDEQIVQLLTLRKDLATRLAQASNHPGKSLTMQERVSAIVSRLIPGNPGPLDPQRLVSIFELVIRVTEPLPIGLAPRNGAAKKG